MRPVMLRPRFDPDHEFEETGEIVGIFAGLTLPIQVARKSAYIQNLGRPDNFHPEPALFALEQRKAGFRGIKT
jgi:hypothetical protein